MIKLLFQIQLKGCLVHNSSMRMVMKMNIWYKIQGINFRRIAIKLIKLQSVCIHSNEFLLDAVGDGGWIRCVGDYNLIMC